MVVVVVVVHFAAEAVADRGARRVLYACTHLYRASRAAAAAVPRHFSTLRRAHPLLVRVLQVQYIPSTSRCTVRERSRPNTRSRVQGLIRLYGSSRQDDIICYTDAFGVLSPCGPACAGSIQADRIQQRPHGIVGSICRETILSGYIIYYRTRSEEYLSLRVSEVGFFRCFNF